MWQITTGRVATLLTLMFLLPLLGPSSSAAQEQAPLWNLAWITDTQTPDCEWIQALTTRLQAEQPEMILHTGDTRFEWANRCAWLAVRDMFLATSPPAEFHLAPGNHDLEHGVLDQHLREAAVLGRYRLDAGTKQSGAGFYHDRVTDIGMGPLWSAWNPEVINHPEWQVDVNEGPPEGASSRPYRYGFDRGGIRFLVADCYATEDVKQWVREVVVQPTESSLTILLQHKHEVDPLAAYFEGLEGRHNVKLVLSGDHHNYCHEERNGITYITSAGMAQGRHGECDGMILWVYRDHVRLDRYIIDPGAGMNPIRGPIEVWRSEGTFTEYACPPFAAKDSAPAKSAVAAPPESAVAAGPNLLHNGSFDNGVWYERFRGWTPGGWYQWFTRGDDAPEHAVGDRLPHSGAEYVRIHMWAHGWRGGILQTVRNLEPCHYYNLSGYGFYQPDGSPNPRARIGIDPCGTLAKQFRVDVTRHPAPPYDEGVGDDSKSPEDDGPDIPGTTVWSEYHNNYAWEKFETAAEARSATINVFLYCDSEQRPAEKPIYEMNWDSFSLVEIPWPSRRLVDENAQLLPDRLERVVARVHTDLGSAEVTWTTPMPCGAAQVLYRFLDSEAVNHFKQPDTLQEHMFPLESPVFYERGATQHRVALDQIKIPAQAVEMHAVALSRALMDGQCRTFASDLIKVRFR